MNLRLWILIAGLVAGEGCQDRSDRGNGGAAGSGRDAGSRGDAATGDGGDTDDGGDAGDAGDAADTGDTRDGGDAGDAGDTRDGGDARDAGDTRDGGDAGDDLPPLTNIVVYVLTPNCGMDLPTSEDLQAMGECGIDTACIPTDSGYAGTSVADGAVRNFRPPSDPNNAIDANCLTVPSGLTAQAYAIGRRWDGVNNPIYEVIDAQVTWNASNTIVGVIDTGGLFTGLAQGGASITASLDPVVVSNTVSLRVTECPFDPDRSFVVKPSHPTWLGGGGDPSDPLAWPSEYPGWELDPGDPFDSAIAGGDGIYLPAGLSTQFSVLARYIGATDARTAQFPDCAAIQAEYYDVAGFSMWTSSNTNFIDAGATGRVTAQGNLGFTEVGFFNQFGFQTAAKAPFAATLQAAYNDPLSGVSFSDSLEVRVSPSCIDGVSMTNSVDPSSNLLKLPDGVPVDFNSRMHLSNSTTVDMTSRSGKSRLLDGLPDGGDSFTRWSATSANNDNAPARCLSGIGFSAAGNDFTFPTDRPLAPFTAAYAQVQLDGAGFPVAPSPCLGNEIERMKVRAYDDKDADHNAFTTACKLASPASADVLISYSAATITQIVVAPEAPNVPAGFTQQLTATASYSDGERFDVTRTSDWIVQNNYSGSGFANAQLVADSDQPYPDNGLANGGEFQGTALFTATNVCQGNCATNSIAPERANWTDRDPNPIAGSGLLTIGPGMPNDIRVQLHVTNVGTAKNCFNRDRTEGLNTAPVGDEPPGVSWQNTGEQVKGGFTTYLRAVGRSGESPFEWSDITDQVTWTVLDPDATGTTAEQVTGRVRTGVLPGTVSFLATLGGVSSHPTGAGAVTPNGNLFVVDGVLANMAINPDSVDGLDPPNPQFGPDPIYIPLGGRGPVKVTVEFVGSPAGGYCVTTDSVLSSNNTNRAQVDTNGDVTAGPITGVATITARVGAISDTIPVNVGPPEVVFVEMSPAQTSMSTDANASVQLHVIAHLTDGSEEDVYNRDGLISYYFVGPLTGDLQPGLFHPTDIASAGDTAEVWACYVSDFIDPTGLAYSGKTCTEASRNDDFLPGFGAGPVYIDPQTGAAAVFNAAISFN